MQLKIILHARLASSSLSVVPLQSIPTVILDLPVLYDDLSRHFISQNTVISSISPPLQREIDEGTGRVCSNECIIYTLTVTRRWFHLLAAHRLTRELEEKFSDRFRCSASDAEQAHP
jgi:hypothetical protein